VIRKKELPVQIIARVGAALQRLLGPIAEQAAQSSGAIVRQRKFTASSLAQTFTLGYLQDPQASAENLAQMAVQCGAEVTPQAIDQRHSPKLVKFLQELFCRATKEVVGSDASLAPILERFTSVDILDSTTIILPDSMEPEYAGCGGGRGGGKAAMKLQVEWDLRSGALKHVEIEPGRSPDSATCRQQARRGKGSLRIADLGYFNLGVFADMTKEGEYFLSRLQPGTCVFSPEGEPLVLLDWLSRQAAQQPGRFIDCSLLLGKEHRLACRLIAWRLPKEQADRRRQKLRREYLSKYGKEPSAERLAWCDWTILVTNVPTAMLTPAEAVILYRARWQVELLFKRWKSQDLVAALQGSTDTRQMVRVWARLLAALVQHWLLIASAWDPTKSLSKVSEAIRSFVGRLAAALHRMCGLHEVLADLTRTVAKACQRNKRTKAGTFELLNDVSRLDFCLT
jgi:Transposase DDE domain